jgi:hypothetical protein
MMPAADNKPHTGGEASTFQCSPALKRKAGETCLPHAALERLRRIWNKMHPDHKITAPGTRKQGKQTDLWSKLREAMRKHYNCDTEYCAVKKIKGLSDKEKAPLLSYFRPEKPKEWDKKPTLWLDSLNIEDVMKQYEAAESTFQFIGPVPIDFDDKESFGSCIVDELCKLDINSTHRKGITKIGIVFNLDKHDEPGSHWVCAFIDIDAKAAYYFDSYGYEPEEEIVRLLERCKQQGCDKIYYNDIRHQRKGSECGMYCMYVIICLLRGRSFYTICNDIVDDDTMNTFRDILYAEEKPRKAAIDVALKKLCM